MKLIFIGDKFYDESKTMMSSLYEPMKQGGYRRQDWGKVNIALCTGEEVHIRPATAAERVYFEDALRRTVEDLKKW